MVLACATHLATSLLYFAPVGGFVVWLVATTLREKRGERRSGRQPQAAGRLHRRISG